MIKYNPSCYNRVGDVVSFLQQTQRRRITLREWTIKKRTTTSTSSTITLLQVPTTTTMNQRFGKDNNNEKIVCCYHSKTTKNVLRRQQKPLGLYHSYNNSFSFSGRSNNSLSTFHIKKSPTLMFHPTTSTTTATTSHLGNGGIVHYFGSKSGGKNYTKRNNRDSKRINNNENKYNSRSSTATGSSNEGVFLTKEEEMKRKEFVEDGMKNGIILYDRTNNLSETQLRSNKLWTAGVYVSTFHTMYWVWYTFDFIPAVNASELITTTIYPSVGYTCMLFGVCVQTIVYLFPRRFISQLVWYPNDRVVQIYTHKLFPTVQPNLLQPIASYVTGNEPTQNSINNSNESSFFNRILSLPMLLLPSSSISPPPLAGGKKEAKNDPVGATDVDEAEYAIKFENQNTTTTTTTNTKTTTTSTTTSSSSNSTGSMKTKVPPHDPNNSNNYKPLFNVVSELGQHIVHELDGQVHKYHGYIKIGHTWPYYILDMDTKSTTSTTTLTNVPQPELLCDALLRTPYMKKAHLYRRIRIPSTETSTSTNTTTTGDNSNNNEEKVG